MKWRLNVIKRYALVDISPEEDYFLRKTEGENPPPPASATIVNVIEIMLCGNF